MSKPAADLSGSLGLLIVFLIQVNIIPVIAKADTLTRNELVNLKIKVMSELVSNGVQIYQFPTEDEAVAEINSSMNVSNIHCKANCECSM